MSAAMPAGTQGDGISAEERVEAAIAQLKRAVDLLDSAKAPPELAARVHEALDAIEAYRPSWQQMNEKGPPSQPTGL